ncbi:MAG: IMP dehydrogenase [Candidatus Aenigmarchaeota archaeon]|nr:IMP dehydrogenase [Candidatus Aenigmarchaeota archaeon]
MAKFTGDVSRSLDEYLIISGRQKRGVTPEKVSLGYQITPDMYIPLGWFSAAMQCVTGDRLSIELAKYGGMGVLPRSLPIREQVELGRSIKKAKAGFNYNVTTVKPDMLIGDLIELQRRTGYSNFPVVSDGSLAGVITEKKYHPREDAGKKVAERMIPLKDVVTGSDGMPLEDANEILLSRGLGILPIVDKGGKYVAAVFWSDISKHVRYPQEFVDKEGRYRFAGAVSTFRQDLKRARALVVEAECDMLVIDTSDAKSDYAFSAIRKLKSMYPEIPLMAGNFIDVDGFLLAAEAGADIVKVGQGPGYGCTTREVKRTGRGQATAIMKAAAARDQYAKDKGKIIPICADGGIENAGYMNIAYALGADLLMMGKYFGEFTESRASLVERTETIRAGGRELAVKVFLKEYWGEASRKAKNIERYGYSSMDTFVPEGKAGLIPHRGSIHDDQDGIGIDIAFVEKTFSESGALNQREFADNATLELQSEGSRYEGVSKV